MGEAVWVEITKESNLSADELLSFVHLFRRGIISDH
ncbi:hypothetical protein M2104_005840 [Paenibacillus sp. PastH-2]|nr:hypothetical protein [Paenibacillus sp. PastH-2]